MTSYALVEPFRTHSIRGGIEPLTRGFSVAGRERLGHIFQRVTGASVALFARQITTMLDEVTQKLRMLFFEVRETITSHHHEAERHG